MKSWQTAVSCLACLAAAGCCGNNQNVAVLERENRLLEDEIYELEDTIEDYQCALGTCRQTNAALRKQSDSEGDDDDSSDEAASPSQAGPAIMPGLLKPRMLRPPAVQLPGKTDSGGRAPGPVEVPGVPKVPAAIRGPSDAAEIPDSKRLPITPLIPGELRIPPKADSPAPEPSGATAAPGSEGARIVPKGDSSQVAQVSLDARLTGGYEVDGRPGDDGIMVVIEPRDAAGQLLDAAAPVSVVVLDPVLSGKTARVARWDFTAEETAALFREMAPGGRIHLEMIWPAATPLHETLHVFVRYTTADGRRLEADGPIGIRLAGHSSPGWAPAEQTPLPPPARQAASQWQPMVAGAAPNDTSSPAQVVPRPAEPRPPKLQRPSWSPFRR